MSVLVLRSCLCTGVLLVYSLSFVASLGYGQTPVPSERAKLEAGVCEKGQDALEQLKQLRKGDVSVYGLHILGDCNVTKAVPELEKQFLLTDDPLDKAQIAQVLVKLKDPNPRYWDYLLALVTPILNNPSPNPIAKDSSEKSVGRISPAFEAWVHAFKLDPPEALQNAVYVYPAFFLALAETEDSRAIPLLRWAVSVENELIAAVASLGLASFNDKASIPLIIAAARKASSSGTVVIAESLGYFDDPRAQAAVDELVPKDKVTLLRERIRKGERPLR